MADIKLSEIMTKLEELENYKIHFAKQSEGVEPLDAYLYDFDEWKDWNRWSNGKDEFNRTYIFSLINFYPEKDTWLFGGIWKVEKRAFETYSGDNPFPYTISLCESYKDFIGRLKIRYAHKDRKVRNKMENYFPSLVLKEILEEPYSTKTFPGYRNLDVTFKVLENVYSKGSVSWESALTIKGIYLITDTSTGKKYVGKASGEKGFWQRWDDYISSGHGGDIELVNLLAAKGGIQYARDYFKFTLLEIVESNFVNELDDRETYWKNVLLTRMPRVGLNLN